MILLSFSFILMYVSLCRQFTLRIVTVLRTYDCAYWLTLPDLLGKVVWGCERAFRELTIRKS